MERRRSKGAVLSEIRSVAATGSTNADLLDLARVGASEGLWLRADTQRAGRGRQGRNWSSPPGNLYASTLIRLRAHDPAPGSLALVAAVALREAVGVGTIKWPNDLLIDGAKVAGILLERADDAVVAGFGVNLTHAPELPDRATTTLRKAGIELLPIDLVVTLAERFATWLARWREPAVGAVADAWLAYAHPTGTPLSVNLPDGARIEGRFDGLAPDGALALRLASGERRTIHGRRRISGLIEVTMLLAIDAGNTNVVGALLDGRQIKARWRIATDPRRTGDEYAVWVSQLLQLEGYSREDVTEVIIGTVVPRTLHNLQVLANKYFKTEAMIAGRGKCDWGMQLDVEEPQNVGADRALNMIAAHELHPGDAIVIDFGTATTFDLIDYRGAYKGGIIAPGINLSLDALVTAAAALPRIAIQAPANPSVIGLNTVDQMHIGIYWGYVAMIEGLVARMKAECGRPVKVIATGGLASLFEKNTDVFDIIEPDLTITGLAILAERAHM